MGYKKNKEFEGVSFALQTSLKKRLSEIAEKKEISISLLMRKIIKKYIDDLEKAIENGTLLNDF